MSEFVPRWTCPRCFARNAADETECSRCGNTVEEDTR